MNETENTKTYMGMIHKKRILLVVRWPVGGIRTFMRYVYRRFDPEQYYFSILGPNIPELDVLAKDLEELDLEIIKVTENPSSYELFREVTKLLMKNRYDLVHSHGFTSAISASLPAFIFRTPHILTSHDVLSNAQFKGTKGLISKIVMGFSLQLVNTIHSVSHDAEANLLEFFPVLSKMKDKCIVIMNGIETERFVNAVPRGLRGELGVGEDVFFIGFLGRFMAQKGFMYLVNAIEKLIEAGDMPKKPLVLAFGEGGFVREEKAALTARGLDEYFRFLPFTANVAGVIKGLDLVVMPSLWEACALLPMETLSAGTPLIATDCIGLREVVRDTPAYVIPSKDSKSLECGIRYFMKNDLRKVFIDFAPIAAKRFDVTKTATSLQTLIYKKVNEIPEANFS